MGLAESREASKHHTASGYRIAQVFADDLTVHRLNPTCKLDVLQQLVHLLAVSDNGFRLVGASGNIVLANLERPDVRANPFFVTPFGPLHVGTVLPRFLSHRQ